MLRRSIAIADGPISKVVRLIMDNDNHGINVFPAVQLKIAFSFVMNQETEREQKRTEILVLRSRLKVLRNVVQESREKLRSTAERRSQTGEFKDFQLQFNFFNLLNLKYVLLSIYSLKDVC